MKTAKSLMAVGLATLAAAPVSAANRIEETVIVSSRVPMPLRQVGTSVSIVTKEDLELRGFNTLSNALRYEPSIAVLNNGGAGKSTTLRIRGESGFRTRVYLDGMELTDTSGVQAGPNFAHLLSNGINRVEILRGPQGVMYGADAGGVINIGTLRAVEGLQAGVSAEYGRYGTMDLGLNIAGANDLGDFSIVASTFETDGFNSRDFDVELRDDDGYDNDTVYVSGALNATEDLSFRLQGRTVNGDNEYDTCSIPPDFEPTDVCTNDHEEDSWRASARYEGDAFGLEGAYSSTETDRDFLSAGISSFATKGELERLDLIGNVRVNEATSLVFGGEYRDESIKGDANISRDQYGAFAEYQGAFSDALFVTAGIRYDDNDDFGSETTYRVSGAYLIPAGDGEIKLKTTYGTGFRAPSLSEIAYNNDPFSAFPPALGFELDAEQSEGFDVGAGYYAQNGGFAEVVYFDQRIEDEIFFDLDDFSGYLQGDGESKSEGVELTGAVPLGDMFSITGNYTYTDAEDAEGERRRRVAKHLANLGLHLTTLEDKLKLSLHLRVTNDLPDDRGDEVDDYEVIDFNASYEVMDDLEVYGRIENLTDEDYQEIPSYNVAGAAGYIGVRYAYDSND